MSLPLYFFPFYQGNADESALEGSVNIFPPLTCQGNADDSVLAIVGDSAIITDSIILFFNLPR